MNVHRIWKRVIFACFGLMNLNLVQASDPDDATYRETLYQSADLFISVLDLVQQEFVDSGQWTADRLTQEALRGMLQALDPHSQFVDAETFRSMRQDTEGTFGGLGISVGLRDHVPTVEVTLEEGPAHRKGLRPDDRIVRIDGRGTENLSLSEVVRLLRGQPGEAVTLTIFRPSWDRFFEMTIRREQINVPTVRDVGVLPRYFPNTPALGYLRITQFVEKTPEDTQIALQSLQRAGVAGLVLDLRNNPGGLLESAVQVVSLFLPEGRTVVTVSGRPGSLSNRTWRSQSATVLFDRPLVILINGNSASAAEIVAASLADHRRAVLVGQPTFGKGSVQSVLPVSLHEPDSGPAAIRLTTAYYLTPAGRRIHAVGVFPHIRVNISQDEDRMLMLRRSWVHLSPEEHARVQQVRDVVLERAVDVLRGLVIQPSDSTRISPRPAAATGGSQAETALSLPDRSDRTVLSRSFDMIRLPGSGLPCVGSCDQAAEHGR